MPRIVELKDQSPLLIRPEDTVNGIVAVCRCGLSANWPLCNGSHKATAGEDPGCLYHYDQQLPQGVPKRHEVPKDFLGEGHGQLPTKATEDDPQAVGQEAAREHHGASPVRPSRPASLQRPAEKGREDAAPPEGPSQAI